MNEALAELKHGKRFNFGSNWNRFLKRLDEDRIQEAEKSLKHMLEVEDLDSKFFLDIGSGSGLFSLAARRLGAKVHSFDYDPGSVECTFELKQRYFPNDVHWKIEVGNVLDMTFLNSLGQFDIVYALGVLHHTRAMWQTLENIVTLVSKGGKLFISICNSQKIMSLYWAALKRIYNQSSKPVKALIILSVGTLLEARSALFRLMQGQNPLPFNYWKEKKRVGVCLFGMIWWTGLEAIPLKWLNLKKYLNFIEKKDLHLSNLRFVEGDQGVMSSFLFER